jgi:hypothetical protein
MHSLLQHELYREMAADRIRTAAPRAVVPKRRLHPPPIRGRVAYATGRLASRRDSESPRKATA